MSTVPSRRDALAALGAALVPTLAAAADAGFRLATFRADVTIPPGHPCMGGGIAPARTVDDPLFAHGFVLLGAGAPVVVAVVDWCEIRNDAYSAWREALAKAAGTTPGRVLVSCVHQHDAPVADLTAERLLRAAKAAGSVCDPVFHAKAVDRVARAVREAVDKPRRITHIGTGQARVEKVASNRRFLTPAGVVSFARMSATRDPAIRAAAEGTVDPYLKTLSFWDGDTPVAALSVYATHPMSTYGRGAVSADFPGLARKRRQADLPDVFQIYASGASGNVTAGKYNDGNPANRAVLADRLVRAMAEAWKTTRRTPLADVRFRSIEYRLKPRDGGEFTPAELERRVKEGRRPFDQCLAAMGLSWRRRCDAGQSLDMPILDLGPAQLLLLPGESYVEYQLLAQKLRPEAFVVSLGYGECGTGYVPTEQAFRERDSNLSDWCWVAPGAEATLTAALQRALART